VLASRCYLDFFIPSFWLSSQPHNILENGMNNSLWSFGDNEVFKYKLKHCREYFTKNKVQGVRPSTSFFVKYEQGDALNDLWNFLVLAYSHTLKLIINKRNTYGVYFAIF